MYIKHIAITGFTSYRDTTHASDLSPNINVVIGRNGAGKSNFFAAIRFAFGYAINKDWLELHHNGRSWRSEFAKVEVTLSDIGSRFPNYDEEITFTRFYTSDGDKFYLNNHLVTKSAVRALLEAAGLTFGGSPFFIVPQGQVTRLANASEVERLDTMLTASGSKTFEDRIQAAQRNLVKSSRNMNEVQELLDRMEGDLMTVNAEADTLRAFLDLRRKERGAKYVASSVERLRTVQAITAEEKRLEAERQRLEAAIERQNLTTDEIAKQRADLAKAEDRLASAKAESEAATKILRAADERLAALTQDRAPANPDLLTRSSLLSDPELSAARTNSNERLAPTELELVSFAKFANADLSPVARNDARDKLEQLRESLFAKSKEKERMSSRIRALHLKQGRSQIADSDSLVAQRQVSLDQAKHAKERFKTQVQKEQANRTEIEVKIKQKEQLQIELDAEVQRVQTEHNKLVADHALVLEASNQADIARTRALLDARQASISLDRWQADVAELHTQLASFNGPSVVRGVQQIYEVVKELKLGPAQYFGTIAELVDFQPAAAYAVDRVAGIQWYYHVVDSAETLEKIQAALRQRAANQPRETVTIIPLRELSLGPAPDFSAANSMQNDECSPLIDFVSVRDTRFESLRQLVFGRHLACKDIDTASQLSRQANLPIVTIEGDEFEPHGAIFGGSAKSSGAGGAAASLPRNLNLMRPKLIRKLREILENIAEGQNTVKRCESVVNDASQRLTQLLDETHELRTNLDISRKRLANPTSQATANKHELSKLRLRYEVSLADLHEVEKILEIAQMDYENASSYQNYAGTLTAQEQTELAELKSRVWQVTDEVAKLDDEVQEQSAYFFEMERAIHYRAEQAEKSSASSTVNTSRYRHREEDGGDDDNNSDLSLIGEADLTIPREEQEKARQRAHEQKELVKSAQELVVAHTNHLSKAEEESRSIEHLLNEVHRKVEKHSAKLQALNKILSDIKTSMNTHTNLPESALRDAQPYLKQCESCRDPNAAIQSPQDLRAIARELEAKCEQFRAQIDDMGTVNMQAINQYEQYAKDLEELKTSHDKLANERHLITETIDTLNQQKFAKLDVLLGKVVKKYEEMFYELSGGEIGTLEILRDPETNQPTSVCLKVPYGDDPVQFSGGQKTLCALALIFAIQICEPAPFYVFDEIDANLDELARRRLANLIQKVSRESSVQFICTTFRKELVLIADDLFGIKFSDDGSVIGRVSRDEALGFVDAGPSDTDLEPEGNAAFRPLHAPRGTAADRPPASPVPEHMSSQLSIHSESD